MTDLTGEHLGNYHLVQVLARGTFADLYLAEHFSLPATPLVVKVLHTRLTDVDAQKFLTAARSIASLQHPYIVQILDAGLEHETPFLVMTYMPTGSLRQLHPKGSQLPLATVVAYVRQVADALQYIHDQKLIHRDIKPHNMLLGSNNEVMLSDFSIAAVSPETGYHLHKGEEFEGTIPYAAPEQILGRLRTASDQYSLGVVVYEWLTGRWPFQGSATEIASQHILTPPPSLVEHVPTLPSAVEQVIFKALAKEPEQRFETVQGFAKALEQASRLEQSSSTLFPAKASAPLEASQTSTLTPLLTYRGHNDKIHAVVWAPRPKSEPDASPLSSGPVTPIASSSLDETVQIWDAETGQILLTYRSNSLQKQAIAWSPNGQYIASTDGLLSETVSIWNASTGRNIFSPASSYSGHTETVTALAWSPDGRYIVSASEDKTVQLWDVATLHTLFSYRGHSQIVKAVAWSPDGKRIASASEDRTVQVWSIPHTGKLATGNSTLIYHGHRAKVNAIAWSPDGIYIASASDDSTVQVWDSSTGNKIVSYVGHSGSVTAMSWSPDGRFIASGSHDETVQVWDATTGSQVCIYRGHADWVSSVAWSPDGRRVASGSWDKTVQVIAVKK